MKNVAKWVQGSCLILSLIWMVVIFGFSAQNGESSSKTSGKVVEKVAPVVVPNYEKLPEQQKSEKREALTYIIRKGAHFSEYALLGLLLSFSLPFNRMKRLNSSLIAFGICVLYAISDEIHQMFSGGRTAAIFDVLIDSTGALAGVLCACLILRIAVHWKDRRMNRKKRTPAA